MRQPLKDLAAICAGQGAPQGDHNYCENGTPFVKAGNLQELLEGKAITSIQKVSDEVAKKHKLRLYPKGTILFAKSGMSCMKGYIYVLPQSAYVVSHLACITPNEDISEYLRYYFNYHKPNQLVKDAAYPSISLSDVGNLVVDMKPESERNEIVSVLQHTESIITLRQRQLQKLDELVKARFIELFGMPGTDAFGWGLVPLGSTCNINPKKSLDSRLVSGAVVSFVPMPAVTEHGEIDATAIKEYDEVKTGFTYFAENDVLFAKITPCMENGKGAVAKGLHNGIGFGSTEFHVLRPISGKTDPYWIYTLTAFSQFRMDAASNMTGSAGQRRVPASFLENYRVSLPPIALQEQFAAFVEQTDKSKVAVQKALDEAQLLFDSLMQKYFE
mgnify:CR=1 FL=1